MPIRIGIAGCGIRGLLFEQALRSVPGVKVTGLCDLSPGARSRASERFPGPIHENHGDLVAQGLDALIIATPDFAHREIAVDAANAGLALLIEKPIATSSEDAAAIEAAVAGNGVSCFVAFENRWNPYFRKVKRLIEDGKLGEVVSVTIVLSNSYYVPTTMLPWSAKSSPGWFLMPHSLDLALWLTGKRATSVVARGRRGELAARGIDTWDAVHALVDLEGSAIANLQSAWTLPDSLPSIVDFRVDVVGTAGSVSVNHTDQGLNVATGDGYQSVGSLPEMIDDVEQSMAAWMVRSWAQGLIAGATAGPDAAHGATVTRVIDAVHRSMADGQSVRL